MNIILDACAVIAYLRDEEGGDVVENFLIDSEYSCYIHAMNLCEVYYNCNFCALALTKTIRGTLVTSDHHEFDRIVPLEICPITFIR